MNKHDIISIFIDKQKFYDYINTLSISHISMCKMVFMILLACTFIWNSNSRTLCTKRWMVSNICKFEMVTSTSTQNLWSLLPYCTHFCVLQILC